MKKLLFIFTFLLIALGLSAQRIFPNGIGIGIYVIIDSVKIDGSGMVFYAGGVAYATDDGGGGTVGDSSFVSALIGQIREYTTDAGVDIEYMIFEDNTILFNEVTAPSAPSADDGILYMDQSDEKIYFKTNTQTYDLTGGGGTVTSVAAGDGMDFTSITTTGSVTMGTPSTLDYTTTNSVSGTTHTHALSLSNFNSTTPGLAPGSGGGTTNFMRADGTWAAPPGTSYTFQYSIAESGGTVNLSGDVASPGNTYYYGTNGSGTRGWYTFPYTGTVTSVAAGNGMSFTTITGSGNVTLGTPSTLTLSTSNSASAGTHTHQLSIANFTASTAGLAPLSGGGTANYLRADGTWATPPGSSYTFQYSISESGGNVNLTNDESAPGNNEFYGTSAAGTKGWRNLNTITVLGTIATGTWQGSVIGATYGGTGLTSISTLLNSNTTKSDVGLSLVENTALSTWSGNTSISSVGTIGTGTWNANSIGDSYIDNNITLDNLTQITTRAATSLTGTAWRVFYVNGTGNVTELGLGASGTYLGSNGTTSAPTWSTPSGSGDVSKVGTPVQYQVGVWTGDGTIKGDADFTFDDNNVTVTGFMQSSVTLASNPALTGGRATPAANGIIFEGTTADAIETLLTVADPTSSDKTLTLPNATGDIAITTSAMTGTYDGNNFGGGAIGAGDILYGSAAGTISELGGAVTGNALISGGTSSAPSWGKIGLTTHVSGNLPVTNLNSGTSASSSTFWRGDATWSAAVTSVAAGNGLDFTTITGTGSVTLGTPGTLTSATSNGVTSTSHTHAITTGIANTNIVRIDATDVATGRFPQFTANGLDGLTAAEMLTAIGAGTGDGTVTSVAAGNGMSFSSITSAGSVTLGTPSTLTLSTTNEATSGTHTHALSISNFSSGAAGLAPASGGGTTNYLRADGTWAAPTAAPTDTAVLGTLTNLNTDTSDIMYFGLIGASNMDVGEHIEAGIYRNTSPSDTIVLICTVTDMTGTTPSLDFNIEKHTTLQSGSSSNLFPSDQTVTGNSGTGDTDYFPASTYLLPGEVAWIDISSYTAGDAIFIKLCGQWQNRSF